MLRYAGQCQTQSRVSDPCLSYDVDPVRTNPDPDSATHIEGREKCIIIGLMNLIQLSY